MPHTEYTKALQSYVKTNGFNGNTMTSDVFYELGKKLTDMDMLLANDLATEFMNTYAVKLSLGRPKRMTCKPAKSLARVHQKLAYTKPCAAFNANSDLAAFRVNVEINDIKNVSKCLREIVTENNGYLFQQNSITDPETGLLTDIMTYYFVYIPEYEYIMEFQIGHEFAAYVFTRNSMLRDNPECKIVNFMSNDFYNHVKEAILAGKRTFAEPLRTEFLALWDQHGLPREQIDSKLVGWFLDMMCY